MFLFVLCVLCSIVLHFFIGFYRSSDGHRADYPAVVQIKHCHNHDIIAASAVKHRDVSETAKLRLEQLTLPSGQ